MRQYTTILFGIAFNVHNSLLVCQLGIYEFLQEFLIRPLVPVLIATRQMFMYALYFQFHAAEAREQNELSQENGLGVENEK